MTFADDIKLLALELGEGETGRYECVACGRKTLSITRDSYGVVWQCFRDSCALPPGRVGSLPPNIKPREREPTPPRSVENLRPLTHNWRNFLARKLGFHWYHTEESNAQLTEDGRVAYPIFSPTREIRGIVARGYHNQYPKALTYLYKPGAPRISHYGLRTSFGRDEWDRTVYLVEDIPSAVRLSLHTPAAALLGTSLTDAARDEISSRYNRVIVALDADATDSAIILCNKLKVWCDVSVQVLDRDIKDSHESEIIEIVRTNRND